MSNYHNGPPYPDYNGSQQHLQQPGYGGYQGSPAPGYSNQGYPQQSQGYPQQQQQQWGSTEQYPPPGGYDQPRHRSHSPQPGYNGGYNQGTVAPYHNPHERAPSPGYLPPVQSNAAHPSNQYLQPGDPGYGQNVNPADESQRQHHSGGGLADQADKGLGASLLGAAGGGFLGHKFGGGGLGTLGGMIAGAVAANLGEHAIEKKRHDGGSGGSFFGGSSNSSHHGHSHSHSGSHTGSGLLGSAALGGLYGREHGKHRKHRHGRRHSRDSRSRGLDSGSSSGSESEREYEHGHEHGRPHSRDRR